MCSAGYATSLNCILSLGKPFGSIRNNSMDGIYLWAISLTPTTFFSLPCRFSFPFFSFFFFLHDDIPYCITNVWHCNIVPTDSFSITNIWQGETDFKTLIFHQYFTRNLQSRCHISLDLCRGALTFFSTLSYPWRWDWKDTLTWRKAFFLPNTDQMIQLSHFMHSKEIWWRTRFFRVISSVSYWDWYVKYCFIIRG